MNSTLDFTLPKTFETVKERSDMNDEGYGNSETDSIQYNSVFITVYYMCARHYSRRGDVAANTHNYIEIHLSSYNLQSSEETLAWKRKDSDNTISIFKCNRSRGIRLK